MYRIARVIGNNFVCSVGEDGQEVMLRGLGIGFRKKKGDIVPPATIEKVYALRDERAKSKLMELVQDVPTEHVAVCTEIIDCAQQRLGKKLSENIYITLTDHISFAIERQKKGIALPNLLLNETKLLYEKEYELGRRSLKIIENCCGVELPEDEAGYIAMHLVAISVERNAAYGFLKFVKGALDIVKETYGIPFDQNSIDVMRLTIHLKFLMQRIQQEGTWEDEEEDPMYAQLLSRDPRHRICLDRMEEFIRQSTGYTIGNQEKFYILIHLTKILKHGE